MDEISRLYAKKPIVKRSNSSLRIQRKKSSQQLKSPADRILFLQRTTGNQAVQRMVRSGALQAKLKIGQPGDVYEQEAHRVADAVMRMPEPGVQRQVEPEEEEEEMLQAKPLAKEITPFVQRQVEPEEEEEELQTKTTSGSIPEVQPNIESQIQSLKGGGQPLSENDHAFFEPRFGHDFNKVRVHTDARAAEAARDVNAKAFTVGRDIVFGAGQYAPKQTDGQRLLAHELTHVVQQHIKGNQSHDKIGKSYLGYTRAQMVHLHPDEPGMRETTITVRFIDDDRQFYHRIINAIARSKEFRGVHKASLYQPFYGPIFQLFRRFNRKIPYLKTGTSIKVRVSTMFDPTKFHGQVTRASVEIEQEARLRGVKITSVLTPQEKFPGRGLNEFGLGEIIRLSFNSKPSVTSAFLGGLKWVMTDGSGTIKGGDDGKGEFTPNSTGPMILELKVVSGHMKGKVVSSNRFTVLVFKEMISRDPSKPERLIILRNGLTPEILADYLYGDKSKASAIWAIWDEKVRGEPWTFTTKIPIGMWIGFEYKHLKPKWKKVYDKSLDIKSRKEWGAKPPIIGDPKRSYEPYKGPLEDILDSIVIHHSGNKGYKTMNEVQDLHLGEKERADIGYHYGISLKGEVFQGRPIDIKGAHVAKANTGKIGIVLLADLDPENKGLKIYQWDNSEDPLSLEMEKSLLQLIHYLIGKYPKIKYLGGHKEFDTRRHCPGKKVMDKISSWRSSTNLSQPP